MTAVRVVAFVDVCLTASACIAISAAVIRTHVVGTHGQCKAATSVVTLAFVDIGGAVLTRVARVTATSVASGRTNTRRPVGAGIAEASVVKLTVVATDTEKTLALIAFAPAAV